VHSDNIYIFSDAQAETKLEIKNGMTLKIPKRPTGSKQTSYIYTFSEINTHIQRVNKRNAHTH
jgi:hypothetical protein